MFTTRVTKENQILNGEIVSHELSRFKGHHPKEVMDKAIDRAQWLSYTDHNNTYLVQVRIGGAWSSANAFVKGVAINGKENV
jgi:hypothetical protein